MSITLLTRTTKNRGVEGVGGGGFKASVHSDEASAWRRRRSQTKQRATAT
ncbi:hypothetical protein BVRB_007470 [Beta vulgaris subsp. vulgaris]|uniref:Uncharacterized protein n=1 Tax=Beta vulgaris subsp. vulgaris TaxID=3555 RepID=A0A0J8B342_BETVV|nr:hypothetical protein BVRB_007470 [Beta vulgaris subsp. vulgaris]